MSPLTPPDAAMYWRSLTAATDQYLLYAFAATDAPVSALVERLSARARGIADLNLTVEPVPGDLDYPRWQPSPVAADQFRTYDVTTWDDCLRSVADLMATPRRAADALWRVHIFGQLVGVPEARGGPANVVVLQISHALGDGRRVSAIARRLLSDGEPDPPPRAARLPAAVVAGVGAATTLPRLAVGTAAGMAAWRKQSRRRGRIDSPVAPIEPTVLNLPDSGRIELRTLTLRRAAVRELGPSVTLGILVAVAEVLPAFGGATRDGRVVVELTVARDSRNRQRNDFHTVPIDLDAGLGRAERAASIGRQIGAARRRDDDPANVAARRAAAAAPAVLEALAVRLSATGPIPDRVAGATVVSSVNRGAGDLVLAGGRVLFTAGFPALSTVHGMTHGVHGIGDTVTVSIAARGAAAHRIDGYLAALRAALA
ncbi:hypothetical protein [Gordonia neofelifaecis]|uniref:O-acyltransferase WSD1 C-terminal domain-containing protein n=1 Tax=Gordonia neofelifaecis NRRL B-59395 TaxID=644548 RepID=F1YEM1_9ACTN|nr:hypothetical protein [Gordonia neofelifaecis]EGD56854.1 hypothetical protein SCNU_00710 [Gordonia neofelifaecis NRRL B-59395]